MTTRISTALRNFMANGGSYAQAFQNGRIEIYTGSQPATADTAVSGTLLCTITHGSAAHTAEVLASGTVTLSGTTSGSVDTLTVDGFSLIDAAVPYNTSLTQTATDLAYAINACQKSPGYTASSTGAVVTIYAERGAGTSANGLTVAVTTTGMTGATTNTSGGIDPANGLKFGVPSGGVVAKSSSQTWSGVNGASGTAGWFRAYGSLADAGGADSAEQYLREDGSIATSGGQLNLSSVALSSGATTTVSAWSRTFPAA